MPLRPGGPGPETTQGQHPDKKREAGICPGIVPHNDPDTSPLE